MTGGCSYSDINTVISEDEGGVGDSKFGVRHLEDGLFCKVITSSVSPLNSKPKRTRKHTFEMVLEEQEIQSL
jgi:hypothetical protein